MTLRIRRIESSRDFEALAPRWAELASESGQASPFLSHDWFSCCWRALPADRQAEVLLVEQADSAVALVPLMRWAARYHGLPVRCLGLLECPDTPFVDMLAAGEPAPVVEAVLDHLVTRSDWDVAHLQKLPAASPTRKALEAVLPDRLPWRLAGTLPSPYLAIEGDWDAFWKGTTQRFKKTARNVQNRLERAGVVSLEEHHSVDPASPVFEDLIGLTRRSWKADRGVAIATMPRMREFFSALTRHATARGWLSLWFLKLDGRPIAMEYQLRADGKVHALRADYDLAYRELSPGSALNFAIARSLFERGGVHEYDMGPGLNDYKVRWATGTHETIHLEIYRPGLYPRLLSGVETVLVPAARRIRGWLP